MWQGDIAFEGELSDHTHWVANWQLIFKCVDSFHRGFSFAVICIPKACYRGRLLVKLPSPDIQMHPYEIRIMKLRSSKPCVIHKSAEAKKESGDNMAILRDVCLCISVRVVSRHKDSVFLMWSPWIQIISYGLSLKALQHSKGLLL